MALPNNNWYIENKKPVIVIGLTAQGLSLVRDLGRKGYHVIGFAESRKQVGFSSKYGIHYEFHSFQELKDMLEEIANKYIPEKLRCIVASGDALANIIQHWPDLYDLFLVESGPKDIVSDFCYKHKIYEHAESKGILYADYRLLNEYHPGDLAFPVILKQDIEFSFKDKAVVFHNQEVLDRYCGKLDQCVIPKLILQSFITIADPLEITCQMYCREGTILACFIALQYRKLEKGLTAVLMELPEGDGKDAIRQLSSSFMLGTGYSGFIELEYLCDKEYKTIYLLEANPRPCGTNSAFLYKFPFLGRLCAGEDIEKMQPSCIDGKRVFWMNIFRDIRARIEKKDFSNPLLFLSCKKDVFDWNDLKPFFFQILKCL